MQRQDLTLSCEGKIHEMKAAWHQSEQLRTAGLLKWQEEATQTLTCLQSQLAAKRREAGLLSFSLKAALLRLGAHGASKSARLGDELHGYELVQIRARPRDQQDSPQDSPLVRFRGSTCILVHVGDSSDEQQDATLDSKLDWLRMRAMHAPDEGAKSRPASAAQPLGRSALPPARGRPASAHARARMRSTTTGQQSHSSFP